MENDINNESASSAKATQNQSELSVPMSVGRTNHSVDEFAFFVDLYQTLDKNEKDLKVRFDVYHFSLLFAV